MEVKALKITKPVTNVELVGTVEEAHQQLGEVVAQLTERLADPNLTKAGIFLVTQTGNNVVDVIEVSAELDRWNNRGHVDTLELGAKFATPAEALNVFHAFDESFRMYHYLPTDPDYSERSISVSVGDLNNPIEIWEE